jgi:hypothetical protein
MSRYAILAAALAGLLTVAPAMAQSAASAIDQPTAGTLPPGTSTVKGAGGANRGGGVAPPQALAPSTDVMAGGKGDDQRVDPVSHLPDSMRRNK